MFDTIIDLESKKYLAENIKTYLELHPEESPESIGKRCDSSKQQIYKLMAGATPPTVDFVDRLAAAMGVTTPHLLSPKYFDQFEKKIVKKKH